MSLIGCYKTLLLTIKRSVNAQLPKLNYLSSLQPRIIEQDLNQVFDEEQLTILCTHDDTSSQPSPSKEYFLITPITRK